VKKTRRALVVHSATEFCGLGAEIASTINEELFSPLKAPAARLGADYAPIVYSREIEPTRRPAPHPSSRVCAKSWLFRTERTWRRRSPSRVWRWQ
jgi:pyruvate/2-oxoglutarate/acetoin dehydrogenase E1 component